VSFTRILSARVLQIREANLYGELRAVFWDVEDLPERVRWLVIQKVIAGFALTGMEYECAQSPDAETYTFTIRPMPVKQIEDEDAVENFL
jgi:hypothetical protein